MYESTDVFGLLVVFNVIAILFDDILPFGFSECKNITVQCNITARYVVKENDIIILYAIFFYYICHV